MKHEPHLIALMSNALGKQEGRKLNGHFSTALWQMVNDSALDKQGSEFVPFKNIQFPLGYQ